MLAQDKFKHPQSESEGRPHAHLVDESNAKLWQRQHLHVQRGGADAVVSVTRLNAQREVACSTVQMGAILINNKRKGGASSNGLAIDWRLRCSHVARMPSTTQPRWQTSQFRSPDGSVTVRCGKN